MRNERRPVLGPGICGIGLASLVVLGLAGCSSSEGFLVPVPSDANAPGTTHVEMVVATTRTRADWPSISVWGRQGPETRLPTWVGAGEYNPLGNIDENYRGAHQFFNDDIIGNLFGSSLKGVGKSELGRVSDRS